MIAEDRIETVGAGIDVVMDHVIVTVVTSWSILAIHLQTLAKTCLTSQESRYGDC